MKSFRAKGCGLQQFHKSRELGIVDCNNVFLFRICTALNVSLEFLERGYPLVLKPVIFGAEIAIDFGVARLVAPGVAKHVLGKKILRVTARPCPH